MLRSGNQLVFSPTDLTIFQESPFASWMGRFAIESPEHAPEKDPADPLLKKLAEKGYAHEGSTEKAFETSGLSLKRLTRTATVADTLKAIQKGFDVIAKAKLEHTLTETDSNQRSALDDIFGEIMY